MNRYLLFLVLLTASYYTSKGQVEVHSLKIDLQNDTFHIQGRITAQKDTVLFHQLLICAHRSYAPLLLKADSVALVKGEVVALNYLIPINKIIDTVAFSSLRFSTYSETSRFIGFSNASPGKAMEVESSIAHSLPRNCNLHKTDSGDYMENPFSGRLPSDSVEVTVHSITSGNFVSFKRLNEPLINVTALRNWAEANKESVVYTELMTGKTPVCRSQNIKAAPTPDSVRVAVPKPTLQELDAELTALDPSRLKELKKDFLPPLFGGTLHSETNFQNYQYPYSLRPANYGRLYFQGTFAPLGVPFEITSLLTSEHTENRKLNYLNVRFDQAKWNEYKAKRVALLEAYMEEQKRELAAKERLLQNQLYQQTKYLESLQKLPALPGIPDLPDSLKRPTLEIPDSLNNKWKEGWNYDSLLNPDTITNPYAGYPDSLSGYGTEYPDSLKKMQARIEQLRGQLEALKDARKKLGSMRTKVDQLKSAAPTFGQLKKIQVGDFYPFFGESTLNGVQVRGADVAYELGPYAIETYYGNCVVPPLSTFADSSKQEYSRRSFGMKLKYTGMEKHHLEFSAIHFKDQKDKSGLNRYGHIRNTVLGFHYTYLAGNDLKIEADIAWSDLNYLSMPDSFEKENVRAFTTVLLPDQSALELKGTWKEKHSKLTVEGSVKRVGGRYFSAGVPFMRTNYALAEIKLKRNFYSNQLYAAVNYSLQENNLDRSQGFRTKMQGFGFFAGSQFKKKPNFQVSYLPFRTISEYTPTEFQAYNPANLIQRNVMQNNVLILNLSYGTKWLEQTLNFLGNYSRSTMILNGSHNQMEMYAFSMQGAHRSHIEYGWKSSVNFRTEETVGKDLQILHQATLHYAFRRFKWLNGLEYASMLPDRKLISQMSGIKTQLAGIEIELLLNVGWVNQNFFPDSPDRSLLFQSRLSYQF